MRKRGLVRFRTVLSETFGLGPAGAWSAMALVSIVLALAIIWVVRSAPPDTIVISAGPKGSMFDLNAEKYREILARSGVKLKILESDGAWENLTRLHDSAFHVDVGFVQGGIAGTIPNDDLVSLGSVFYEPLLVFYRAAEPLDTLSALKGKRIAIGSRGSGTRLLALALLKANGMDADRQTVLLDLEGQEAASALMSGKIDAAFLMGDSAGPPVMRALLYQPGVRLLNFSQADGYARRFVYLNKLELPMGSIDFGKNLPRRDLSLVGPTVELVARENFHPALNDLLLEAAREVHGKAGLLQRQGEFPAPLEHEFRISEDAQRYYKSGKGFLYRNLPFWLASLVNRLLVALVPVVVILIPGLRIIPSLYQWRVRLRIYRWYRALLTLEREMLPPLSEKKKRELLSRLDEIERAVDAMKVPASFADQFYVLRINIGFVRNRCLQARA